MKIHLTSYKKPLTIIVIIIAFLYWIVANNQRQDNTNINSLNFINAPKISDIYFLDYRLIDDNLRPNEKYRLAKVVDITGDIVTLLYSDFFYSQRRQIESSIHYGHLRFKDYFQTKRYNFAKNELVNLQQSGAIYQVMRPIYNRLFGNYVNPLKEKVKGDVYIPGKREYFSGMAFLQLKHDETKLTSAFEQFNTSARLGYPQGQVSLAELYINEEFNNKDLSKALYWLKQGALQSHKPAILKYVILCKQQSSCSEYDFYQTLIAAGVNIKVRNIGVKID